MKEITVTNIDKDQDGNKIIIFRISKIRRDELKLELDKNIIELSGKNLNLLLSIDNPKILLNKKNKFKSIAGKSIKLKFKRGFYFLYFILKFKNISPVSTEKSLKIDLKEKSINLKGTIRLSTEDLNKFNSYSDSIKNNNSYLDTQNKIQDLLIIKKKNKALEVKRLVKQFDIYEEKIKNELNSLEKRYQEKGIRHNSKNSKNKCLNCISFDGKRCNTHDVLVNKDYICKRFNKYIVYRGGGFSPK